MVNTSITHDPRLKRHIKNTLYARLYDPVTRRLQVTLDSIIIKNTTIGKHTHKSFVYKGELYNCDQTFPPRKGNQLDASLKSEMEEYLKEIKTINETEIPYVMGYIDKVLNSFNSLEDYLLLFPSSVHDIINQFIQASPCKTKNLSDPTISLIYIENEKTIDMMCQRQALNSLY